ERAVWSAPDQGLDDPGAVLVLVALGPVAGSARVFDLGQIARQAADQIVAVDERHQEGAHRLNVVVAQIHAELGADLLELGSSRQYERHGLLPLPLSAAPGRPNQRSRR